MRKMKRREIEREWDRKHVNEWNVLKRLLYQGKKSWMKKIMPKLADIEIE